MNSLYNTQLSQQQTGKSFHGYSGYKMGLALLPESLLSMALCDVDGLNQQQQQLNFQQQPQVHQQQFSQQVELVGQQSNSAAFHPVDDYKDMSLRELLDLSDDYLFGDADEEQSANPVSTLNPIPVVSSSSSNESTYSDPIMIMPLNLSPDPTPIVAPSNNKKRRRQISDDEDSEDDTDQENRFRPYQAGQWSERFEDLCRYREKTGNCLVPHTYKENLPLARWVKRQRYQYKLMKEGKPSTMTEERVRSLEEIGFVWDSQGAAWGERLTELQDFRKIYMHCNVPSNYSENPQLATWVKCQRRQFKLYCEGKPSNMTPKRIEQLEGIGFEWLLRSYKKARTN